MRRSAIEDFAAAHRAQQIEDLLALFQPLRGVLEEGDDLRDRVFHAVELGERGIALDDAVGEDARQARVVARIDHLGLADRGEHALGGGCVDTGIALAQIEVVLDGHLLVLGCFGARGLGAR